MKKLSEQITSAILVNGFENDADAEAILERQRAGIVDLLSPFKVVLQGEREYHLGEEELGRQNGQEEKAALHKMHREGIERLLELL